MINRDIFFSHVRHSMFSRGISQSQVNGITAILDEWDRFMSHGDIRFLAYMLATTYHETAATMQPIEEYGHGRGRAYGVPTGPWHQVYDGRGDVQLTWLANYEKATLRLRAFGVIGPDVDLVKNPALAMRQDIAAAIMFYGMTEGWFTGKKLLQYFHGSFSDPASARRIINGTDKAATIAGYHQNFLIALASPTSLAV